MKRNYYPNYKNWMEHPNSESSKQRNEQRMKNPPTKICCADCGSSNGTLHKIKRNGIKTYVEVGSSASQDVTVTYEDGSYEYGYTTETGEEGQTATATTNDGTTGADVTGYANITEAEIKSLAVVKDATAYNRTKPTAATASGSWRQFFVAVPSGYGAELSGISDSNKLPLTIGKAANVTLAFGTASMNRSELIAEIVERTGQTKKAVTEMVDAYEETVYDAMRRNEVVALHGFLKFERRKRKGHKGNDLKNNGLIDIPDSESVKVTPGNTLKNVLRNSG